MQWNICVTNHWRSRLLGADAPPLLSLQGPCILVTREGGGGVFHREDKEKPLYLG